MRTIDANINPNINPKEESKEVELRAVLLKEFGDLAATMTAPKQGAQAILVLILGKSGFTHALFNDSVIMNPHKDGEKIKGSEEYKKEGVTVEDVEQVISQLVNAGKAYGQVIQTYEQILSFLSNDWNRFLCSGKDGSFFASKQEVEKLIEEGKINA